MMSAEIFGYVVHPRTQHQRVEMFRQELVRLEGTLEEAPVYERLVRHLEQLTPGDFAVAARQFELPRRRCGFFVARGVFR